MRQGQQLVGLDWLSYIFVILAPSWHVMCVMKSRQIENIDSNTYYTTGQLLFSLAMRYIDYMGSGSQVSWIAASAKKLSFPSAARLSSIAARHPAIISPVAGYKKIPSTQTGVAASIGRSENSLLFASGMACRFLQHPPTPAASTSSFFKVPFSTTRQAAAQQTASPTWSLTDLVTYLPVRDDSLLSAAAVRDAYVPSGSSMAPLVPKFVSSWDLPPGIRDPLQRREHVNTIHEPTCMHF